MFQGVVGADGAYKMNWTSDSETFTVTIEGRTRGWVGFGISGTGGMREADIMVAWVDDSGTGHILVGDMGGPGDSAWLSIHVHMYSQVPDILHYCRYSWVIIRKLHIMYKIRWWICMNIRWWIYIYICVCVYIYIYMYIWLLRYYI